MYHIVFDLEATCWKNNFEKTMEIIEIGAVKMDETGVLLDEFSTFVKPKVNPILSSFCMTLTTITQAQIDEARPFDIVIKEFIDWIGPRYKLCSWGAYDKKQLIKDCMLYDLSHDWVTNHINIKGQYQDIHQLAKPIGMPAALERESMTIDGTHHRGIDDARNISKIYLKYFDKWNDAVN